MDSVQKAVVAGTEMAIAIVRGQSPIYKEGWKKAEDSDVGWPNASLQSSLHAFTHPDSQVVRRVSRITQELGAIKPLPPNLDMDFLYIDIK